MGFVSNFVGRADFLSVKFEGDSVISDIGIFKGRGSKTCDNINGDLMIRPDDVDFLIDPQGNATNRGGVFGC